MALIPVYHVVAASWQIDPTDTTIIPQGILVGKASNGKVDLADGASRPALGIAGDSASSGTTSYTANSGSALSRNPATSLIGGLTVGAYGGARRFTENRVSEGYNEVLASGEMTVYHSGGEFWTDQYEIYQSNGSTLNDFVPGDALYASAIGETAGEGEADIARSGRFTEQSAGSMVGRVLDGPQNYPNGVPGIDTGFLSLPEGGNSMTWGMFLHVKLMI